MTKGVLISAWGRRGYIYAAYNLAFSIKHFNRRIPVYLYCDPLLLKELLPTQSEIFDEIIPIDVSVLMQYSTQPAYIKISAYQHLPFDHTLLLDVDALALRDIEPAIDQMIAAGGPFYSHILGLHKIEMGDEIPEMYWMTANKIWDKYKLPQDAVLPCTNSSLQFIKKCDESKRLMDRVKQNMDDPFPLHELRNQWGGAQPDELYLNIAMAQEGITGKLSDKFLFMGNVLSPLPYHKIQEEYFILSIFGGRNFTKPRYTEWYDKLLIAYCRAHAHPAHFKYSSILRDKHANVRPVKYNPASRFELEKQSHYASLVTGGKSGERIFYFSAWFKAKTAERQAEIDACLLKNLSNEEIEKVFVVSEDECNIQHPKLTVLPIFSRPTYDTFFKHLEAQAESNVISIIANGDIWMDAENVRKLRAVNFTDRTLALSRWDLDINDRPKLFNYEWSQDTWILRGKPKAIKCPTFLGVMQCDNRLVYEMVQAGYQVSNPSKDIRTYHLHKSGERNYDVNQFQEGQKLPVRPTGGVEIMKKRLLINQPGKVGDIILCAPIAMHYSEEYFIDWHCPEMYHSLFKSLPYAQPVSSFKERDYDRVIDLSFGLGGKPEKWWQANKARFASFVEAKYELAGVPVQFKSNLVWNRSPIRENALYEIIKKEHKFEYILVHESSDYGTPIKVGAKNIVKFQPILDFTIFDWYKVIRNASQIHCIDSSLCNFVDAIPDLKAELFYYKTDRVPNQWDETLLTKNWKRAYENSFAN